MQQVKEPMDLHNNLRALRIFTELRSADSFTCEDVSLCRSGYSSGVTECCLYFRRSLANIQHLVCLISAANGEGSYLMHLQ